MKDLTKRTKIILLAIFSIIIISPWLGGGTSEGFAWELTLVLTSLSLLLFTMIFHVEHKKINIPTKPWALYFLGLFCLAGITGSIFSIRAYNSWSTFIMWLAAILLFFIISQLDVNKIYKHFSWVLISLGLSVSLVGFILFITSASEIDLRLDSIMYNPNFLAGYLIGILPLNLVLLFYYENKKIKLLLQTSSIIISTAFILTVSYTGWVSFLPLLIFIIIFYRQKIFNKKNLFSIGISLLIIISLVFGLRYFHTSSVSSSFALHKTISDKHAESSFNQRWLFIKSGLQIFCEHPITGIGFDNMQLAYQKIQTNITETPKSTHNQFIDVLAELGIFGFIGFVGFIILLFFNNYKYLKNNIFFTGLFLGWLGIIFHGSLDFIWQKQIIVIHFFLLSGFLYAWQINNTKQKIQPKKASKILLIIIAILAIFFLARGVQLSLSTYYQTHAEKYEELQNYTESISLYNKAWGINKNYNLLEKRGILEYTIALNKEDAEYLKTAENTALELINLNPNQDTPYRLLGNIYKSQNKLEAAEEQFNKALELSPLINFELKQNAIEIYYLLDKFDLVISEVDEYIEIYNIQRRPKGTKKRAEAISYSLAKMLDIQGDAYLAINNKEQAINSWQRALEERPSYGIAQQKIEELRKIE